jgi:uncharacterized DUF497 family protein
MEFEWDESKNAINQKKHGITFDDARNVFADPQAITRIDRHESDARWQIMGHWGPLLLILVVYTMRRTDSSDVIRIISARKATVGDKEAV